MLVSFDAEGIEEGTGVYGRILSGVSVVGVREMQQLYVLAIS